MNLDYLAKRAANRCVAASNLYNMGLTMAGCDVAYAAALAAGATPSVAFEIAREHMLVQMLPREVSTQTQRMYRGGERAKLNEQNAARVEQMRQVAALPNPFDN